MDIVDIDKVLDDFELNEDRNSRSAILTTKPEVPVPLSTTATDNQWNPKPPKSQQFRQEELPTHAPRVEHHSDPSSSSKSSKSNFVNVSNVFLSLNEYMNAGIDTTSITEPLAPYVSHGGKDGMGDYLQETIPPALIDSSKSRIFKDIGETSTYSALSEEDPHESFDNDRPIVSTEHIDDSENKLFTNTGNLSDDEQSTSPLSADSTTMTDSSSSDELGKNSSEDIALLENKNDEPADDEKMLVNDKAYVATATSGHVSDSKNMEPPKQLASSSSQASDGSSEESKQNITASKCTDDAVPTLTNSLEESLSVNTINSSQTQSTSSLLPPTSFLSSNNDLSINQPSSTTTTLPVLSNTSIVSISRNDDPADLSEQSDRYDPSVSHLTNENGDKWKGNEGDEKQHPSKVVTNKNIVDNEENIAVQIEKCDNRNDNLLEKVPEPESQNKFIKPLCFEAAATMDDVSDTELESYLQELEDLECSPAHTVEFPKAYSTLKYTNVNEQEQEIDADKGLILRDDKNADSFSQASTVEFADVGLETDFDPTSNAASNKNSNIPEWDEVLHRSVPNNESYQLTGEPSIAPPDACPTNVAKPSDEVHSSGDMDVAQQLQTIPQRPNTLELPPSYNETMMQSAAGSTPAARQLATNQINAETGEFDEAQGGSEDPIQSEEPRQIVAELQPPQAQDQDPIVTGQSQDSRSTGCSLSITELGKVQPYWIPDSETTFCMQCNLKFSFIKRRHHCRACGQVLCSTCCSLKAKLAYMGDTEARICVQCDILLNSQHSDNGDSDHEPTPGIDVASAIDTNQDASTVMSPSLLRSPNPNNPMEYCSTIPPLQQVGASSSGTPIAVMVPVGVLKRDGVSSKPPRKEKNVMFSDGIRPGCDLTDLDNNWGESSGSDGSSNNYRKTGNRRVQTPPGKQPFSFYIYFQ